MRIFKEFKEFAIKGNAVDIAIGVIIGTAFGKIVSSIVADVVMPPVGLLLSGVDFSSLAFVLQDGPEPVLLKYGTFINTIIDFTIIAFVLFMAVKGINKFKKKEEETPAIEPSSEEKLLTEIRDILKAK
ncbi:MAG: large-conductance mechanosensitive channel protein MscL [Ignavibacteria bacterium]|nr:large-conductance mechanosensitive channel protein MscL [Ignavibacteria bacterium]